MDENQMLIDLASDLGEVEILGELKQNNRLVNDKTFNRNIVVTSVLLAVPATMYILSPLIIVPIAVLGIYYCGVPKLCSNYII